MPDFLFQVVSSAAVGAALSTLVMLIAKSWISEKIKNSIKSEYDEKLETHKAQLKSNFDIQFERIKLQLSNRAWRLQQQWGIREQKYAELLGHLTKFRLAIHAQHKYFIEPYDAHDQEWMRRIQENGNFQKLELRILEANEALREVIGPASIFLSDKTIAALDQMEAENYGIANFSAPHLGEYVEETRKVVDAAYEAVLQEARIELAHHRAEADILAWD